MPAGCSADCDCGWAQPERARASFIPVPQLTSIGGADQQPSYECDTKGRGTLPHFDAPQMHLDPLHADL